MNAQEWLGPAAAQAAQLSAAIILISLVLRFFCARRPHLAHALLLVVLLKCLTPPVWSSTSGVFSWIRATQETTVAGAPAAVDDLRPIQLGKGFATIVAPTTGSPTLRARLGWAEALFAVWVFGVATMLTIVGVRWAMLRRRIVCGSTKMPEDFAELLERMKKELGIRTHVRLVVVREAFGPAVFGLMPPTLVLPEILLGRPLELSPALAHELAHVRRRDHWVASVQLATVVLWWFNPLVWWMNRQIERARELCCDEEVIVGLGFDRHQYAQMLLDVVRWRREVSWPALGMRAAQVTQHRLEHILGPGERLHRRTPPFYWVLAAATAVLLLPGAACNRFQHAPAGGQADAARLAPATQQALHFTGTVLDKVTRQGIRSATVTLRREAAREPEQWDLIGKPEEIQTDARGQFQFAVTAQEAADKKFCLTTEVRHPQYASRLSEGEGLSLILDEQKRGEHPWFENLEMAAGEEVSAVVQNPDKSPAMNCRVDFASLGGTEQTIGIQEGSDITLGQTTTDDHGRFTFLALKGSNITVFTVYPEAFSSKAVRVDGRRGDLGAVLLSEGVRIGGRLIDENGHPVTGAKVQATSEKQVVPLYGGTERSATSDASGNYNINPMEPGAYRVAVDEDDRFLPAHVNLLTAGTPTMIDFKPAPANFIHMHFLDSAGKPSAQRNRASISAWKGDVWFHSGFKGDGPEVELRYPRGMEHIELELLGSHDHTMLWRKGSQGAWRGSSDTIMGAPTEDVTEINVIIYKSPTLTVKGVDARGNVVGKPQILYEDPALHLPAGHGWFHDINGDVGFEPRTDGTWTSADMLVPDKAFELSIAADGFRPVSQKLNLREGEERQVDVQLEKESGR